VTDTQQPRTRHARRIVTALAASAVLLAAACSSGGSGGGKKADGPVHIKVWAWYPAFKGVVDHFNATHTDVKVDWTVAGTGGDEYTKLQTALKAGKGAADVVMVEFQELPTIELTKHLVDLGKYGAGDLKANYADWAWKQVSDGDKVYAIPVDAGPMGLLYRQDLFTKYHLKVPATWDEFKQEAQTLKAADPKAFMTDFGANDAGFMTGLAWQAGARPYTYSASNLPNLGLDINNDATKKVMSYWQEMVGTGLADSKAYGTTDFYNGLSSGRYLTYIAAGWGPGYLQSVAKTTSGKWRAAPLPQWNAGDNAQGDWGGSTFAVTDQSDHPKEAAEVAKDIFGTDKAAWKIGLDQAFLFPTVKPILDWSYFQEDKYAFFGGQQVNKIFGRPTTASGASTGTRSTTSWPRS
jgi:multiple sugar transport system substrate-binding protein